MYVCKRMSRKGLTRLVRSHTSIILMYEVFGRLLLTEMNMVVRTNMTVTLTDMVASKKNSLKKFDKWPTRLSMMVGAKIVNIKLRSLLPRTISTVIDFLPEIWAFLAVFFFTKYCVSSLGPRKFSFSICYINKVFSLLINFKNHGALLGVKMITHHVE